MLIRYPRPGVDRPQSTRGADNVAWELKDMSTGSIVGSGPPTSKIYLGGHEPNRWRNSASGNFVGNIANLMIFDRVPKEDDVDCMYRSQASKIG